MSGFWGPVTSMMGQLHVDARKLCNTTSDITAVGADLSDVVTQASSCRVRELSHNPDAIERDIRLRPMLNP